MHTIQKEPGSLGLLKYQRFTGFLFLVVLTLAISAFNCLGKNKQKKIRGTASILMNDEFISIRTYKEMAREQAINAALEKAFGSTVINNYEHIDLVSSGSRQEEFRQHYKHNYINTFPNGRWVQSLEEPQYGRFQDDNEGFWMECTVYGLAEPVKTAPVNFIAKTLDGENQSVNSSSIFLTGESGYIYFKSPTKGYLSVYFDDWDKIEQCLPYKALTEPSLKIQANKDYIFFSSKKCDYLDDKNQVDEIEFFTDKEYEHNRFYILFSPNPIQPPILEEPMDYEGAYTSFWHTNPLDFMKWLQECRLRDSQLQVQVIWITIKNSTI